MQGVSGMSGVSRRLIVPRPCDLYLAFVLSAQLFRNDAVPAALVVIEQANGLYWLSNWLASLGEDTLRLVRDMPLSNRR